jgi:heme transport system substrate-binding protein
MLINLICICNCFLLSFRNNSYADINFSLRRTDIKTKEFSENHMYKINLTKKLFCLLCGLSLFFSSAVTADSCQSTDSKTSYNNIISIGGSITEILYALGCSERIIAVDSTSMYPQNVLKEKKNVGYKRAIAAEPIISLNPDLILADSDTEPVAALEQMEKTNIRVEKIKNTHSIENVYEKISRVANILNISPEGEALINSIRTEYQHVKKQIDKNPSNKRVLFLLSVGTGPIMAAGTDTSANEVITLAGGINVFNKFSGFKPVTPEAILAAAPDYILMTDHALAANTSPESILERPEFIHTPAGQKKQFITMNALYLLGFGPRTPEALKHLSSALK